MDEKTDEMILKEESFRGITPENYVELHNRLLTVDAQRSFGFMIPDIPLSNYKEHEINFVRSLSDYSVELMITKPVNLGVVKNDGSMFFIGKIYMVSETSRGRMGFQQKVFGTSTQKLIKQDEASKKPFMSWRPKK